VSRIELLDNSSGGIGPARMEGEFKGGRLLAYNAAGKEVIGRSVWTEAEIAELVGAEVARKLLDATPQRVRYAGLGMRQRELAGLDLEVGGVGMRGFYDEMLPKLAAKLTKKWGGKVSKTRIETGRGKALSWSPNGPVQVSGEVDVHSLDITDPMREAALEGLPLFHKKSMIGAFRRRQAVQNGTFDLTEGSRTSRWWNLLVFKAQDRFYDLLRLQDQAKIFRSIAQIPDTMDAYLKETLYHGRVEQRVEEYEKQFVEPLVAMMKSSGYSWQQIEDFLYARHAPEAN
jgi:hypothetical protein